MNPAVALIAEDHTCALVAAAFVGARIPDAHDPPRWHGDEPLATHLLPGRTSPHALWFPKRGLDDRLSSHGPRRSGFSKHGSLPPQAIPWQRRFAAAVRHHPDIVAVVACFDPDDATEGLHAAADQHPSPVAVLLPHPEAEAWLLAGLAPLTPDEAARLRALKLPFDPTRHPERLSAKVDAKGDAKRVLRALLGLEPDSRPLHVARDAPTFADTLARFAAAVPRLVERQESLGAAASTAQRVIDRLAST